MKLWNRVKTLGLALVLSLVGVFGVVSTAAAEDMSTGIVTAITAVNPQISAVVVAMAGAIMLIVAWKLLRKAFGGG